MFKKKQNQILSVKCKVCTHKNVSHKDHNLIKTKGDNVSAIPALAKVFCPPTIKLKTL